ncbi:MAG TPA: endonuclease/exonuclease/phosphatase family protein [Solirubrobacterales bacterium]|nr:endonuclease/exonuclease/phosphatase family protein [Solirubrobacterales bacterium]
MSTALTRRLLTSLAAAVLALALLLPATAAAKGPGSHGHQPVGHDNGKGKVVGVMTRNLYLGADLGPVIAAKTTEQVVEASGAVLRDVVANNFPVRAKGLAHEILEQRPDLVGLQEVAYWHTTPITPAGEEITIDYLQLLLNELNKGPGPDRYEVVVVQNEFGTETPADFNETAGDGPGGELANAEVLGQLQMRDVILARAGAGVHTWNASGGNFNTLLELSVGGQPVAVKRGWTATDAQVRGSHPFHFVNTHLEAFDPFVRVAQAEELVAPGGPATSSLPVVLVGDLNSDDDTVSGPDQLAYQALLAAGFVERSTNDPLGCCLESPLLAEDAGGSVADFDHQVDHVMTNEPSITLERSAVTGLLPVNGYWDSDHAGLFSALRFPR